MLKIKCDFCPEQLKEAGALLFGPPTNGRTRKLHMCKNCFHRIMKDNKVPKLYNPDTGKTTCCGDHKPKTLCDNDDTTFC